MYDCVKLLNTNHGKKNAHLCWYYCIQNVPHSFYGFWWRSGAQVFSAAVAGAGCTGLTESRLLVWFTSKRHESILWNMRHNSTKNCYQTSATLSWYVFIEFHLCLIQSWQMPPVLNCKFSMRAFAGPELVWIWSAEAREREKKRKQKILSILFKYPNCTCLSTSTSLTHRPFALAKQLWDLSLYLF